MAKPTPRVIWVWWLLLTLIPIMTMAFALVGPLWLHLPIEQLNGLQSLSYKLGVLGEIAGVEIFMLGAPKNIHIWLPCFSTH